jgi:hypothetical protein
MTPNMHTQGEVLAQELDIPTEPPPSYTATPQIPLGPAVAGNTTNAQTSDLRAALTSKRQGSLYLRPYKAANQIDAVQLLHYGKTYLESILFDLPVQEAVHISWSKFGKLEFEALSDNSQRSILFHPFLIIVVNN